MPVLRRLSTAVLVIVLAGCGVPRTTSAGDSTTTVATSSAAAEQSAESTLTLAPSATEIAPSSAPPTLESQPDDGDWPPTLLLTDLKEAGLVEITVDGVRFQLPAGSTATTPPTAGSSEYSLRTPDGATTGTATVQGMPGTADALTLLTADPAGVTRVGSVEIPGAASAALAEAGSEADRSWILGVVTAAGDYVRAEFRAPAEAFDDLLIYPSLCSVKIG